MGWNKCLCLFGVVLFLCGQLILGMIIRHPQVHNAEDLAVSVKNFVKESTTTSFVDIDAGHQNQSKVVAEFTKQYTSLLIELTASEKFDFVIQYENSPQSYKYEYVCKQTADCFKLNHHLPPYTVIRFIVQTTPETFNVHGKYYLK